MSQAWRVARYAPEGLGIINLADPEQIVIGLSHRHADSCVDYHGFMDSTWVLDPLPVEDPVGSALLPYGNGLYLTGFPRETFDDRYRIAYKFDAATSRPKLLGRI